MFRQCFLKYMQGYLAACIIFVMASLGLMNISEGGLQWLFFSPAYLFSELLKSILFFYVIWYFSHKCFSRSDVL
jgi:hypothetical protein